jgi:hypothetical protein
MAHAFFLGVDLVETDDGIGATLTMLEKEQEQRDAAARYRVDYAREHTADSPAAMADSLQSLVAEQPYIGRTNLIVNRRTAAGQALLEALTDRGLDPIAAVLTDGSGAVAGDPDETAVRLGTVEAVHTLADLYRDGRVTVEDHTTEAASRLARGVQRAAERLDEADGNQDTPAAAGNSLDDLGDAGPHVLSAALAAWCGTERSFDPSQHLKSSPQTQQAGPDASRS